MSTYYDRLSRMLAVFLVVRLFSSRWYLCVQKSSYALHPISQKFSQRCLRNGSNVRLIDDGRLSSFQGRSSSASPFHASHIQAIDDVMSSLVSLLVVPLATLVSLLLM